MQSHFLLLILFSFFVSLVFALIGKDDRRVAPNQAVVDGLKKAGIEHTYQEVEGAHMWGVWRATLADFLPRLFKPAASTPAPNPTAAQAHHTGPEL